MKCPPGNDEALKDEHINRLKRKIGDKVKDIIRSDNGLIFQSRRFLTESTPPPSGVPASTLYGKPRTHRQTVSRERLISAVNEGGGLNCGFGLVAPPDKRVKHSP